MRICMNTKMTSDVGDCFSNIYLLFLNLVVCQNTNVDVSILEMVCFCLSFGVPLTQIFVELAKYESS